MNDYQTKIEFQSDRPLSENEIKMIILRLSKEKGIVEINVETNSLQMIYYSHLQSTASVKDILVQAGFPFKPQSEKPGLFKRFVKNIADENKKTYGNKRLDCCST